MVNFFRKICQSLLSGNPPSGRTGKFPKYLFYANGEIVLVVGVPVISKFNTKYVFRPSPLLSAAEVWEGTKGWLLR
jgi:hypothetical protein